MVMRHKGFKYLDGLIHSGEKEIVLDADILLEDGEESQFLNGIELDIDFLTIRGDGHSIDACGKTRIFDVTAMSVKLHDIVFKNACGEYGGAIKASSSLYVGDSIFQANHAEKSGGAIFNQGPAAVRCENCSFLDNSAGHFGGAISNLCIINISECDFQNNKATRCGGAIFNHRRRMAECTDSSFSDNSSECFGGAILNFGIFKVEDCNFKNNCAKKGGAIFTNPDEFIPLLRWRSVRTYCMLMDIDCDFENNEGGDVFRSEKRLDQPIKTGL